LRNACVCAEAEIRAGDELDLSPDLLAVDYGLGTIGLVHIIQPSITEPLTEQAKRHVDQATYLRHLLVSKSVPAGTPDFPLQYTVECVLVILRELMPEMTAVVREIVTRTRFLHATGLNLLPFSAAMEFEPNELKRAFAWLLPAVRQRMSACGARALARLDKLTLTDYRLPGSRFWELTGKRVHLIHGANGTGKSSLAEALELAVTGSVERITTHEADADYAEIIRHSQAEQGRPAAISITLSGKDEPVFEVVKTGVSRQALKKGLPVTAFRLDQTVMDQLMRADSQQRARVLTRSFFPGDAYRELEETQTEFNNKYKELPPELRREIESADRDPNKRPAAIVPRLEWVEAPQVPAERIADCLPLAKSHLEALARIVPGIADSLKLVESNLERKAFDENLQKLDDALAPVKSNVRRYRDAVVQSLKVLQNAAGWTPARRQTATEYHDLMRDWSERLALEDLLTKHVQISQTLVDASTASWAPNGFNRPGLFAASAESLQQNLQPLHDAMAQCKNERASLFDQMETTAGGGKEEPSQASLATGEIEDLNLTGSWFARQEPSPPAAPLGDTVQSAMSERKSKVFGSITIGSPDWTRRLVEFLTPLPEPLDALLAFDQPAGQVTAANAAPTEAPVYRSPVVRLHAYRAALASARKVSQANQKVEATLMNRLTEHKLNEALDEVITLFTPARWAYEGLLLKAKLQDGKVRMDLATAKTDQAELRLNTAELNLAVLALYLICGPTIENPIGTLILDDPLQNMDELTSATVARGLSKIAALVPDGWQLVLMFHGVEDLETFRREVPASVYKLPWLGPIGAGTSKGDGALADSDANRAVTVSQHLHELVRVRASAARKIRAARGRGSARPPVG
jgi:AAA domain